MRNIKDGKHDSIKCLFFSEFHHTAGPQLSVQFPKDYISKEEFDMNLYVITKPVLKETLIVVSVRDHKVVGCPMFINKSKYERNWLIFNLCFVFASDANTSTYETIVRKLAGYFTTLESECNFLSEEQTKEKLPEILQSILENLNSSGVCHLPISTSTTIHLKILEDKKDPPLVNDHDVPIWIRCQNVKKNDWDLAIQQLVPYIDGFRHVARIAEEADVDIDIVKTCIKNLIYFGVVKLICIFQYSNVYVNTPAIHQLCNDSQLKQNCLWYVAIPGKIPTFRDVFRLYCNLVPGTTVRDMCLRDNPRGIGVDERKLIQFGLINGLIRRLHKYAVRLLRDNNNIRNKVHEKYLNGCHSYDEICCQTGVTYQELEEHLENDLNIAICWK